MANKLTARVSFSFLLSTAYSYLTLTLTEALTDYQEALASQTAKLEAEQEIAEAAVEGLKLDSNLVPADDDLYDIVEVTDAVNDEVSALKDAVIEAAKGGLAANAELTESNVNLAKNILNDKLTVAQNQVDALKQQAPKVVDLQQKIIAYNNVVEEINETYADFEGEAAKFEALNDDSLVSIDAAADADDFSVDVNFKVDTDDATVTITFEEGKMVVTGDAITDPDDEVVVSAEDVEAAFAKLKNVDALKASIEAVYGNIAKQAAASEAVGKAALAALKAEGYKVYEGDAVPADGAKPVSWTKVKVDAEGNLVAADTADTKNYVLATKDAAGAFVEGPNTDGKAALVEIPEFTNDGADKEATLGDITKSGDTYASSLGINLPSSILGSAALSEEAVTGLGNAEKAVKGFDKALENYEAALEVQQNLKDAAADVKAANEAVTEAEKAFDDLGYNLVKADEGVADGELYDEDDAEQLADLFVFAETLASVDNFDGNDQFYFGDKAAAIIVADEANLAAGKQLGGDANVLEIFAVQNGANTDLYVEKAAFAGNSSNDATTSSDFVKVELVGVNAEDLQFNDGFLTFA